MLEYKIVQYKKQKIFFDEESVSRSGKKVVKHMQRNETDEEFFERVGNSLTELSAQGWSVANMNNVMPSYTDFAGGLIFYGEYFSFLLSREKS